MKTIINTILVFSIFLMSGCYETPKLETSPSEKLLNTEKQDADIVGGALEFCEDVITFSLETIFPEDYEWHSSDYADAPTYQQCQNIEALNCFLSVLEAFANGSYSANNFRMTDTYEHYGLWTR